MPRRNRTKEAIAQERILEWVERVAAYLAQDSLPPIAGRILGWLMVCSPPEQSAAELAEAIDASRASITTNMQVLTAMGFVRRRTRPGARTEFFRLQDGAWEAVVRRQVAGLVSFGRITGDGLALVGDDPERSARLREAQEIFEWLRRVFENAEPPPSGMRIQPPFDDDPEP